MLWINNTETSYHYFRDLYHQFDGMDEDDREGKIMREAYDWYGDKTPDGLPMKDVFWEEVREHMDDDNSDILADLAEASA